MRTGMLWFAQLILAVLVFVTAPLIVALALPFARQDKTNCLPTWLQWLNTYDDPGCDQGMYEPQVAAKMAYGWRFKTWYWLGWRNQMYGLFHSLAPVVKLNLVPGFVMTAPFTPGTWFARAPNGYFEWDWVWSWSATKCGKVRIGWKLEPTMHEPRPLMFCLQIKPYLTKG